MKIEERMAEIAQAYCTERNSHKVMDSELMIDAVDIAVRIAKEYAEEQLEFVEAELKRRLGIIGTETDNFTRQAMEANLLVDLFTLATDKDGE